MKKARRTTHMHLPNGSLINNRISRTRKGTRIGSRAVCYIRTKGKATSVLYLTKASDASAIDLRRTLLTRREDGVTVPWYEEAETLSIAILAAIGSS